MGLLIWTLLQCSHPTSTEGYVSVSVCGGGDGVGGGAKRLNQENLWKNRKSISIDKEELSNKWLDESINERLNFATGVRASAPQR